MLAIIRIAGIVGVPAKIEEGLYRLRLRRKYSAVLIKPTKDNLALLKTLRNYVAFGTIDKETLIQLIEKRAKQLNKNKKLDPEKIAEQIEKKSYEELNLKPFFRLHPPRKGIESKKHAGVGKGVLGDNKEKINDLIRRML